MHQSLVRQGIHQLLDQPHVILYPLLAPQVTTHGRCLTLSTFVRQAMLVPNVTPHQLCASKASIPLLAKLLALSARQDTSVLRLTLVSELHALRDSTLLQAQ